MGGDYRGARVCFVSLSFDVVDSVMAQLCQEFEYWYVISVSQSANVGGQF